MQIPSSMGRSSTSTVNITLIGAADVQKMLYEATQDINTLCANELIRAGAFAAFEVQQSIMGLRGEPKSVDTGNFANSIQVGPVVDEGKVKGISIFSDVEYAPFLEYGTIYLQPRAHFQNTAFRIAPNLKEEFNSVIKEVCGKAMS